MTATTTTETMTTTTKTLDERLLAEIEYCYQCALDAGTDEDREELAAEWTVTAVDFDSILEDVPDATEEDVLNAFRVWKYDSEVKVIL